MKRALVALLLLQPWLLAVTAGGPAAPADTLTASSLASADRLWPYRVSLVEDWQPAGREKPLRAGTLGVLIRVATSGVARIDFGSAGKYEVPVDETDLVEQADRIRRGELEKSAPNFTEAIGTRLVDSAGQQLSALAPAASADRPGFLCVFADPDGEEFGALAAALAPLSDRHGVMTILFPQGRHRDAGTREQLRSLGWSVPFVYDFLSEAYASTLLADGTPMPTLLLQTNEGRVLFQGRWSPDVVPELTAALDSAFGGESRQAAR